MKMRPTRKEKLLSVDDDVLLSEDGANKKLENGRWNNEVHMLYRVMPGPTACLIQYNCIIALPSTHTEYQYV